MENKHTIALLEHRIAQMKARSHKENDKVQRKVQKKINKLIALEVK